MEHTIQEVKTAIAKGFKILVYVATIDAYVRVRNPIVEVVPYLNHDPAGVLLTAWDGEKLDVSINCLKRTVSIG